jgi:thiol-disulfide isomerase/thioredoxin
MRVRLILPALMAAALIALTGCGAGGQQAARASAADTLNFTGTTLDGKKFDATSLKGKPVMLWFWAPWCASCASEAQTLTDVAPRYQGKVDIVGVAGMGREQEMRKFVSDYQVGSFPHLSDGAGTVWRKFGITEQSVYVLIDRTGKVTHKDWIDFQDFPAVLDSLAKT